MTTTNEYTVNDLTKLQKLKAKDITIKITKDDPDVIDISMGSNIKSVTLYFQNTDELNPYNIGDFKYKKNGKNLEITSILGISGQKVVLKNYFTNAETTSLATKSVIKNIKYDVTDGQSTTIALFDLIYVSNGIDGTEITYNPSPKGYVYGTPFGDTIDHKDITITYGKNNKGLTINTGTGADTITGTKNNDTISGGAGVNTINFDFLDDGFGKDTVKLTKNETLILNFTNGDDSVNKNDLTYTKSGNNLIITKAGDTTESKVTIQNYFKDIAKVYINDTSDNNEIKKYLTEGDSVLNISGKGKFSGTNYSDNITGNKTADTITTKEGNDRVNAGAGNDTIKLGAGNKTVEIGYADGNDTITLTNNGDQKTTSLNLVYDTTVASNLIYALSTNKKDLYIYRDNNQYTLIKNYYVAGENNTLVPATTIKINGVALPETNTTVYNLSKNNKITIDENNNGDFIFGNKNDTVTIQSGDNNINLLKGNDAVIFGSEYKDDTTIKTSGGTDSIKISSAEKDDIDVEKVGNNIEITTDDSKVTISNYRDITSSVTIKDKNNKVVNVLKSGSGKINGTANDDIIVGSTKNDTITAGAGINEIYTRGGNDTIVLSNKGFDIIDSTENTTNSVVNVKTNTMYFDMLHKSDDSLSYSEGVDKKNFTYVDFFKDGTTADLYTTVGKTKFHIVNETDNLVDYSAKEDNNIVFLTEEVGNGQHYVASEKINVVHAYNDAEISYNGGHDVYYTNSEHNNIYNAKITSNTLLEINDVGGDDDTLNLNNAADKLNLFFNVDLDPETTIDDNGYLIYDKTTFDYNHAMSVAKGNTIGSISIIEYDTDETGKPTGTPFGKIENINIKDFAASIDMDGWKNYVSDKVKTWLESVNKNSVIEVLTLNQTKAANQRLVNDLVNIFKKATYDDYINSTITDNLSVLKDQYQSDLTFVKSGNDLVITTTTDEEEIELARSTNYFSSEDAKHVYYAKNALGDLVKHTIGENEIHVRGVETVALNNNTNKISFDNITDNVDYANSHLTVTDGVEATLTFNDKEFLDFYTKKGGEFDYAEGDPLIYKGSFDTEHNKTAAPDVWKQGGNNLTIGDVQVDNVDGKTTNILIVDKDGLTKTIMVGAGTYDEETQTGGINGTFESEIIVGSNGADTINAMGGDDLIYSGDGDDVINFVKPTAGEATRNNTAPMVVIGGSDYLPANHTVSAISIYDTSGNDTYNTTLDVGVYIEDMEGSETDNDTINITGNIKDKDNDNNDIERPLVESDMRYIIDVINPHYSGTTPTFYADLFVLSTEGYKQMTSGLVMKMMSGKYKTTAALMSSVQGSFGYVWIDDQYYESQEIENINVNGDSLDVTIDRNKLVHDENDSYVQTLYQTVAAWLSVKGYGSAWSVVEQDKSMFKNDCSALFAMYNMTKEELVTAYNGYMAQQSPQP